MLFEEAVEYLCGAQGRVMSTEDAVEGMASLKRGNRSLKGNKIKIIKKGGEANGFNRCQRGV